MAKNRNYSFSDVDMLMGSKTVAENFIANLSELSAVRTDWTESFASNLLTKIDNTIEKYLGIDPKKALRNATSNLGTIQVSAKRDISFLKTQIDDDFKKEKSKRDEILKTLGFTKHLRSVQKGNQESLILLLYSVKNNMTDNLRGEITAKGINGSLIDNIIGYADAFQKANITQETFKESTKEITKEVCDIFNEIYDEIIGICKKASVYYQFESLKKEQFTFSKVIDNLGASRKVTEKKQSQPAA